MSPRIFRPLSLAALIVASPIPIALGQTFHVVDPVPVDMPTSAQYDNTCFLFPTPCNLATANPSYFAPFGVWDRAWLSDTGCHTGFAESCGQIRAAGHSVLFQRGDNSPVIQVFWGADAMANYDCRCNPAVYYGLGTATLNATMSFQVNGPPGPIVIGYRWFAVSGNMFRPEAAADDRPNSVNCTVSLGVLNLVNGQLDLTNIKGILFDGGNGTINANTGDVITLTLGSNLTSNMDDPPRPVPPPPLPYWAYDAESVAWWGQMTLAIATPLGPTPPAIADFSIDLGSASELSSVPIIASRKFDPGDAYRVQGPVLPAFGANGVRDDRRELASATDPNPVPPAAIATAAPLCSGALPADLGAFFDLDDFDEIDVDLRNFIPTGAPAAPIPRFSSNCIYPLGFLYVSYDDDKPDHYTSAPATGGEPCSIPTGSTSGVLAFGNGRTYGQTASTDEVWLVVPLPVGAAPGIPMTWGAIGIWDEARVHPDLVPNPDLSQADDDDVDGLDVRDATASCPYFVFTVDHEARSPQYATDSGATVFQHAPGGFTDVVVNPAIHLGLLPGTDIRGLEFVFAPHPTLAGEYLALLFSVAPDDPATFGTDESGGLNPRMIYISYLDGNSQPLLDPLDPLIDNVDAISNYTGAYVYPTPVPVPSNDGCANAANIAAGDVVAGSTITATAEVGVPTPCGGLSVTAPGVWYVIMGDGSRITASLCGQVDFDSQLFVYGGDCGALTCVAADDDSCQVNGSSRVSFCTVSGVPYRILITGFGTETGDYTLAVTSEVIRPGTSLISTDSAGTIGNDDSISASISADGRYVAFASTATNLVPGDTNGVRDVFVRDRQTNTTERISVSSANVQGNGISEDPRISSDGRYVAFRSAATNLVAGDTNGQTDIFLRDRLLGVTTRESVSSSNAQAQGNSSGPVLTPDARFVVFSSSASNLVAGDTNSRIDVFVRDRQSGTTTRESIASGAVQGNGDSGPAVISSNGRYVAFASVATNLVVGDTNGFSDIFVHDRQTTATTRVSIATGSAGAQGNGDSYWPSISADGRYVSYHSGANNLVSGDTNGSFDIFFRDRQLNLTFRVSRSSGGVEGNDASYVSTLSSDGRYVAFFSAASNLVPGDMNAAWDVFLHDRQTSTTIRTSVNPLGAECHGFSSYPSISPDARFIAFESTAPDVVPGDANAKSDVFVHLLNATLCPMGRDMNCDGLIDGKDISPFVLAILNGAGYAANYPTCNALNGDMNGDGAVTVADVPGFVAGLLP